MFLLKNVKNVSHFLHPQLLPLGSLLLTSFQEKDNNITHLQKKVLYLYGFLGKIRC